MRDEAPTVSQPAPPLAPSSLFFQASAETDKLFDALAKAQAEIETAEKDSENPHFNSTFANLASVWRACRAQLSKLGISITQWPIPASRQGHVAMLTRVTLGDQWASSGMEMPVAAPGGPQQVGSSMTYLRRYMLSSVAGVAPDEDDDDGNAAQGSGKPEGSKPPGKPVPPKDAKPPSEAQIKRLFTIAKTGPDGWTNEQIKEYIGIKYKIDSTKDLTRAQYDEFVGLVEKFSFQQACVRIVQK
jgi:hypothetical protein